jgi:hypothetical protein
MLGARHEQIVELAHPLRDRGQRLEIALDFATAQCRGEELDRAALSPDAFVQWVQPGIVERVDFVPVGDDVGMPSTQSPLQL